MLIQKENKKRPIKFQGTKENKSVCQLAVRPSVSLLNLKRKTSKKLMTLNVWFLFLEWIFALLWWYRGLSFSPRRYFFTIQFRFFSETSIIVVVMFQIYQMSAINVFWKILHHHSWSRCFIIRLMWKRRARRQQSCHNICWPLFSIQDYQIDSKPQEESSIDSFIHTLFSLQSWFDLSSHFSHHSFNHPEDNNIFSV